MKWNWLLWLGTFSASQLCAAEDSAWMLKDYNKLGLEIGSGSTNEEWFSDSSNVSIYALSYRQLWRPNWFSELDYSGQFFHPDGYRVRVNRYLVSVGYRLTPAREWDVFVRLGLGYVDSKAEENQTDRTLSRQESFLQRYTMGLSYQLSEQWFTKLQGALSRSDFVDEDLLKLSLDYQWNPQWRTGIYYRYRDTNRSNYSNEGGLSAYWTF